MASLTLIRVSFGSNTEKLPSRDFNRPFRIGRGEECDVRIRHEYVSRVHAEVVFEKGKWWIRDLQSGNGLFIENRRIQNAPVDGLLTVRLGIAGPIVSLQADQTEVNHQNSGSPEPLRALAYSSKTPRKPTLPSASETQYLQRYFGSLAGSEKLGQHTLMIRRAYEHVSAKQRRKYGWVIGALLLLMISSGVYAFYLHQKAATNRVLAQELFYSMKSLDVDIARVERIAADSDSPQGRDEIHKFQNRRNQIEKNYDRFITALHVYDPRLPERQRLIMRVARIFGESEIAMPIDFIAEVENYIRKWQASGRLTRAISVAKEKGYNITIYRELIAQDLPPQFFYLALQESNFDPYANGPMTRKGIAKGMWQFIPEQGAKYGLRIGPLVELPRADPADERDHYDMATKAAVRYIKDLYSTDAQASGLLVMSCYNWGEDSVLPLVRTMAQDPRERNFWQLLVKHRDKIPRQTYEYVFYIVSAAVIGENPRLFGFNFDNPLLNP